ncbi:MAG: M20 family metallopeptidase [Gemmatimonadota bacterium]|nr:MAG: M20 family metallopeptidase [Gemmatimonadota bacterium]
MVGARARQLLDWARAHRQELVEYVCRLASAESPTAEPGAQRAVLALLQTELERVGLRVRCQRGRLSGGMLLARPGEQRGGPFQLLLGHCDTVWPTGTLQEMPVEATAELIRGPGVFDMKGGLAQLVFALRALSELELEPDVRPVALVNSDEEMGSRESSRYIEMLARRASRALVLEPAFGPDGRLKTARKGGGRFEVVVIGKSAHAGLDPEAGTSAILELSHVIQKLHALNDPERGVTVNVGVIEGGYRPNVVAARARAVVDVRVPSARDAARIEYAIGTIRPVTPGSRLEVTGRIGRPPMERTAASRTLWEAARLAGTELGLTLHETAVGGMSDGNTASLHAPTLDGLGPIGDGAHAAHEFISIDGLVERTALLAMVLLLPVDLERFVQGRTASSQTGGPS